jgi:SAM-dependent methyltransferase
MNPSRSVAAQQAWASLHAAASAPYRRFGRFTWHFARGKLRHDPVFVNLLERGLLRGGPQGQTQAGLRVVDIGCGQGIMASLLQACQDLLASGGWPSAWPAAPQAKSYLGVELMSRDVRRAQESVGLLALHPQFLCADMREAALPACDLVVILDVLHYADHASQEAVLGKVRRSLSPGGRLLLRVGDQSEAQGFAISQWVDRVVTRIRGHRAPPTWGRPLQEWISLLQRLGFTVQALPMSQGTPFANVLMVADCSDAASNEPQPGSGIEAPV